MKVQIIEKEGHPEWAILPYQDYLRLREEADMLQDIRDYDAAREELDRGDELIPSEVTFAILDGENPIKLWRKYRGLTQKEVAEVSGISIPYMSQIETGKRVGTPEVLSAIARALDISLDEIVFSRDVAVE